MVMYKKCQKTIIALRVPVGALCLFLKLIIVGPTSPLLLDPLQFVFDCDCCVAVSSGPRLERIQSFVLANAVHILVKMIYIDLWWACV